ncbi:PREDICTED: uncharacterized protein LOC103592241 isoform X6 [Galeopterus variegatus]|uniref:Uncharacterized protein LOC103592241 isoform X6 n=1 Tax=Galeopterus variegatus TaxID=482537 RepID=A0ABM0QXK4_GALVR|nr:PREDICTED: uncharacterized protein LOC103592241 isoform X6 [Galeopterus variegatus]
MRFSMLLMEMWPGLSSGCIPLGSPPQSGVQAQQPWYQETPTVPERLRWAGTYSPSSLWDEVTILRSQLQSQAQVTEALRQAVQGLLEEQEQQKYQISTLEASLKLLQRGPEGRALLLEQHLERLRRELEGLRYLVQEQAQAQAQMRTGPGKCSTTSVVHQELQTERQLLWEESKILQELKLLRDQLRPPFMSSSLGYPWPPPSPCLFFNLALKSAFWTETVASQLLLRKLGGDFQRSTLSSLEPSSFQLDAQSFEQVPSGLQDAPE